MSFAVTGSGRAAKRRLAVFAPMVTLALLVAGIAPAVAEDAVAWLQRSAAAAKQLNYVGTIVYQHGSRVETSRLVHLNDAGGEFEKLVNLDGPAREVIRSQGEVRCYYPDAKIIRVEPRTFRNAFPSLSSRQLTTLATYYEIEKTEPGRVAGLDAQSWMFKPKDGLRYGHKFWVDAATSLLLKARILNERGDVVEQFAFTEVTIGAKVDRAMVKPTWPATPPDWQVREAGPGEVEATDTPWVARKMPPGFRKIAEGYRTMRGKREPVAHLVFTDDLVAISVFIEPMGATPHPIGLMQQGGVNIYIRPVDDYLITVLGEAPGVTVRQIANSVARR